MGNWERLGQVAASRFSRRVLHIRQLRTADELFYYPLTGARTVLSLWAASLSLFATRDCAKFRTDDAVQRGPWIVQQRSPVKKLTYAQVAQGTSRAQFLLKSHLVNAGDRVLLPSELTIDTFMIMIGCMMRGAVPVFAPSNPADLVAAAAHSLPSCAALPQRLAAALLQSIHPPTDGSPCEVLHGVPPKQIAALRQALRLLLVVRDESAADSVDPLANINRNDGIFSDTVSPSHTGPDGAGVADSTDTLRPQQPPPTAVAGRTSGAALHSDSIPPAAAMAPSTPPPAPSDGAVNPAAPASPPAPLAPVPRNAAGSDVVLSGDADGTRPQGLLAFLTAPPLPVVRQVDMGAVIASDTYARSPSRVAPAHYADRVSVYRWTTDDDDEALQVRAENTAVDAIPVPGDVAFWVYGVASGDETRERDAAASRAPPTSAPAPPTGDAPPTTSGGSDGDPSPPEAAPRVSYVAAARTRRRSSFAASLMTDADIAAAAAAEDAAAASVEELPDPTADSWAPASLTVTRFAHHHVVAAATAIAADLHAQRDVWGGLRDETLPWRPANDVSIAAASRRWGWGSESADGDVGGDPKDASAAAAVGSNVGEHVRRKAWLARFGSATSQEVAAHRKELLARGSLAAGWAQFPPGTAMIDVNLPPHVSVATALGWSMQGGIVAFTHPSAAVPASSDAVERSSFAVDVFRHAGLRARTAAGRLAAVVGRFSPLAGDAIGAHIARHGDRPVWDARAYEPMLYCAPVAVVEAVQRLGSDLRRRGRGLEKELCGPRLQLLLAVGAAGRARGSLGTDRGNAAAAGGRGGDGEGADPNDPWRTQAATPEVADDDSGAVVAAPASGHRDALVAAAEAAVYPRSSAAWHRDTAGFVGRTLKDGTGWVPMASVELSLSLAAPSMPSRAQPMQPTGGSAGPTGGAAAAAAPRPEGGASTAASPAAAGPQTDAWVVGDDSADTTDASAERLVGAAVVAAGGGAESYLRCAATAGGPATSATTWVNGDEQADPRLRVRVGLKGLAFESDLSDSM